MSLDNGLIGTNSSTASRRSTSLILTSNLTHLTIFRDTNVRSKHNHNLTKLIIGVGHVMQEGIHTTGTHKRNTGKTTESELLGQLPGMQHIEHKTRVDLIRTDRGGEQSILLSITTRIEHTTKLRIEIVDGDGIGEVLGNGIRTGGGQWSISTRHQHGLLLLFDNRRSLFHGGRRSLLLLLFYNRRRSALKTILLHHLHLLFEGRNGLLLHLLFLLLLRNDGRYNGRGYHSGSSSRWRLHTKRTNGSRNLTRRDGLRSDTVDLALDEGNDLLRNEEEGGSSKAKVQCFTTIRGCYRGLRAS
mmetsp:Transcript_23867/g.35821  ORF Transcript_23867/g.35821 Transcript_23867/m.35821 type:complete len:301 (-) Transcript_23867:497-1399(-)